MSPDDDVPPEVQLVSEKLSSTQRSNDDVTITLILHSFQAALGTKHDLKELRSVLQVSSRRCSPFLFIQMQPDTKFVLQTKQPEQLEQLLEAVTGIMEAAASTANLSTARQLLTNGMEQLREKLSVGAPADNSNTGRSRFLTGTPFVCCTFIQSSLITCSRQQMFRRSCFPPPNATPAPGTTTTLVINLLFVIRVFFTSESSIPKIYCWLESWSGPIVMTKTLERILLN